MSEKSILDNMTMKERHEYRKQKYQAHKTLFIKNLEKKAKPFKFNKKEVWNNIKKEYIQTLPQDKLKKRKKHLHDYYERRKLKDPNFMEKQKIKGIKYYQEHREEIIKRNHNYYLKMKGEKNE
jgi:hypothetical protein